MTEKLSSGYKVNRAADDAAGLTISEKMRQQIRGLSQAVLNAQDGVSMVQIADGAMEEIHAMLQRGNELGIKAANGTLTQFDRDMIDKEIQQLKKGMDELSRRTLFNELEIFPEYGIAPRSANGNELFHYNLTCNLADGTFTICSENADVSGAGGSGAAVSSGSVLADKIANEFLPNAVKQIFDAFPSLKNATGSDVVEMGLDISFLDGPGNTLAYAQLSYTSSGRPVSMMIKVDDTDFDDQDAEGTGDMAEELESTLAHELMHSVMQYTMTDEMTGRAGEEFPTWFTEGTAQLAGGGFPTNWNAMLEHYAGTLGSATDASQDANIKSYLQSYTIENRPYGHGYLAAAYLGYLAHGGGDVTGANIAAGMDEIFSQIINNNKTWSQAVSATTGLSINNTADVQALFSSGNAGLVEFVRKLSYASHGGAGSVIASSLGTGGTNILGNSAPVQAFRIDPNRVSVDASANGVSTISLQVGADANTRMLVDRYRMDSKALGLELTNVKTQSDAYEAIEAMKSAIDCASSVRSYYGAVQNRLEHTISNLQNVIENTTAAESAIRDTDMADMMVKYSNQGILLQAGQAMLAQANQQPEMILSLL